MGPWVSRVRLVQRASGLEPADNRAVLDEVAGGLAGATDLVVLPEAFARDFGEAGSALGPYAEPLDGPFASTLRRLAGETSTAWLAGMFETSPDSDRPWNTLVLADGTGERVGDRVGNGVGGSAYRKIHLYDSFGYRESGHGQPRRGHPGRRPGRAASRSA